MKDPRLLEAPESEFVPPYMGPDRDLYLKIVDYNVSVVQHHVAERFRRQLESLPPDAAVTRTIMRTMRDVSATQRKLCALYHALQPHHTYSDGFRWKLLLEEALANGVRKRDASGIAVNASLDHKDFAGREDEYNRLTCQDADLVYGLSEVDGETKLVGYMQDPGVGFNPNFVADGTLPANIERGYGRGMLIIAEMCKDLGMRVLYFPKEHPEAPEDVCTSEMYWEIPLKGTTEHAVNMFYVWRGVYDQMEAAQTMLETSGPDGAIALLDCLNAELMAMEEPTVRHAIVGGLREAFTDVNIALSDGRKFTFKGRGDDAMQLAEVAAEAD
jgi:hypothetical protein